MALTFEFIIDTVHGVEASRQTYRSSVISFESYCPDRQTRDQVLYLDHQGGR